VERGDYDLALDVCTKLIKLTSSSAINMATCYNNRGLAYMGLGRYREAIEDFNTSLEANPSFYGALANRGLVHVYTGEYREAVDDITAAMNLGPEDVRLYANRGNAYFYLGKYGKALSDLDKAIELNNGNPNYFIMRGLLNKYLGYDKYALSDFDSAAGLKPDFEYAYLLGITSAWRVSKEEYQKRINGLKSYIAAHPSDEWVRSISMYYTGGKSENDLIAEAEGSSDAVKAPGMMCEAYYYIGEERLRQGDAAGAAELFNKSVGTGQKGYTEYTNSMFMLRQLKDKGVL